jgi:hypothetical protein
MLHRTKRCLTAALVMLAVDGCMPSSDLLRDLTPGNGTIQTVAPIKTCSSAKPPLFPAQSLILTSDMIVGRFNQAQLQNIPAMGSRIQLFKQRILPSALQREPVVQEIMRGVGTPILQAQQSALQIAGFQTDWQATSRWTDLDADSFGEPRNLSYSDFLSFASTLHATLLEMPISNPSPDPITLYGVHRDRSVKIQSSAHILF